MTNDQKISITTKTLFGFGSVADGVKNTAFNIFLLFYYTQAECSRSDQYPTIGSLNASSSNAMNIAAPASVPGSPTTWV